MDYNVPELTNRGIEFSHLLHYKPPFSIGATSNPQEAGTGLGVDAPLAETCLGPFAELRIGTFGHVPLFCFNAWLHRALGQSRVSTVPYHVVHTES